MAAAVTSLIIHPLIALGSLGKNGEKKGKGIKVCVRPPSILGQFDNRFSASSQKSYKPVAS